MNGLPSVNQLANFSEWLKLNSDDTEEETCPMCQGEQYIALRCKCGNMPEIGEEVCDTCGAPAHIKTCPCCLGKGVIYA